MPVVENEDPERKVIFFDPKQGGIIEKIFDLAVWPGSRQHYTILVEEKVPTQLAEFPEIQHFQ